MTSELLDDVTLLRAHVDGDSAAFGQLVTRHRDRMWAVALRTTGDPEEAADALQDALVSAFRRAEAFRGDAAVTTWLHRIVVNACLDRLRRRAVRRADPLPEDLDRHTATGPDSLAAAPPADPLGTVLDDERRRRVHEGLRELPEEQRVCLVLVDLEQWPVAEVAEHLGIAVGTVKSRCHRGRARLATLLADLRPSQPEVDGTDGRPRASESHAPATPHPEGGEPA